MSIILALFMCVILPDPARATVPQSINYQGILREGSMPVTGTRYFEFYIYDAAVAGNQLYDSGTPPVAISVSTGQFRYTLTPAASINWQSLTPYIEVHVGSTPATMTTLMPRDPIGASVYALFASTAETVVAGSLSDIHIADEAGINPAKIDGVAVVQSGNLEITGIGPHTIDTGNVGIGTVSPVTVLDVNGDAQFGFGSAKSTFTADTGALLLGHTIPTVPNEAVTMGYVQNQIGGGGLLSTANTWAVQQTFSSDVYMSAGQINIKGNRLTTFNGRLDAGELANFVPNTSIDGSSITKMGNVFNGANQLVKLDAASNITVIGSVTASAFIGDGSHLSGITSAVLPSTIAYTTAANTFTSSQTFVSAGGIGVKYGVSAATGNYSGLVTMGRLRSDGGAFVSDGGGNVNIGGAQLSGTLQLAVSTIVVNGANMFLVPAGAIMFFNSTTCPDGWTDFATTNSAMAGSSLYPIIRGTGLSTGTIVGTGLSQGENRPVGMHSHAVIDAGHTHSYPTVNNSAIAGAIGVQGVNASDDSQNTSLAYSNITIQSTGTVAGTNAPYIQLLMCVKNGNQYAPAVPTPE